VWQIVVIFMFIMAVTVGLSGPLAAQTLVTRWFVNRRGRALGISALGTSIGGFIIPIVTTSLIAAYGWREACFILGVSAFVILLPVAWAVVDEPKGSKGHAPSPADETSPEAVEAMAAASDMTAAETLAADRDWRVMEVLREPSFWLLIAACLPLIVCFNAIQYNLGPLMQDLGIPAQRGSLIVSAMAVSMIFGKLLFGHQADIRPHRYLVALMGLGFVFCGFAFMQASSFLSLLPAAIIMGFATGGFMPLIATIIGTRFGARSFGRVSGLTGPVMAVGSFGPLLAGWMRDVSGSYQPVFVMVVCLAAVAAVIGLFLPDRVREQSPS
jgi:sugar phosphate permease